MADGKTGKVVALRAVFFDLDGTLKPCRDPYHHIHYQLGFGEKTEQFARMFRQGEIDSDEWIRHDVALWQGVSRRHLVDYLREIPYTRGAVELVRTLRSTGAITAVVSTGLQLHAELVQADLDLNYALANEVVFEAGIATGEVVIHVHEADKKSIVQRIIATEGLCPDECMAVGDGESDIGMFESCRIGVAFRPTCNRVRQAADLVIEEACLANVLPAVCELVPDWREQFAHDARWTLDHR